jgi:hypothetical protein
VREPLPEDLPILEAYNEASAAFVQAATSPSGLEALAAYNTPEHLRIVDAYLARRHSEGAYLETKLGLTSRPYVLVEPRSLEQVFVFDCQLDGTYWASVRTGAPLAGEVAQIRAVGVATELRWLDDHWAVASSGENSTACAG